MAHQPESAPAARRTPWSTAALTAAALSAALVYQLMLLVPLALVLGMPALWYPHPLILGAAGLGFVILAWALQPGRETSLATIARGDAPELYRWIDALSARMDAPPVHAIALVPELNAGALELHRGVSLRPTRRVLVLGTLLLSLLDRAALEAVIAHEFGHFSRRHGRLGHWLYRTQAAWAQHLDEIETHDSAPWERAGQSFAQWFVPWFEQRSFAHSRRCEYEADRFAADALGADSLGSALCQLGVVSLRWRQYAQARIVTLQLAHAEPPPRWLHQVVAAMRALPLSAAERNIVLATGAREGTHPPVAERLRALGLDADDALARSLVPAGEDAPLVDLIPPDAMARAESVTDAGDALAWRMAHAAVTVLGARLDALRAEGRVDPERVRLAWAVRDASQTRELAEALIGAGDETPAVRFCLAGALALDGAWQAAIDRLQQCIELAPVWAVPARLAIIEADAHLQRPEIERARVQGLLISAQGRRRRAVQRMAEQADACRFDALPLDASQCAAATAALRLHPVLASAWCVGLSAEIDARRRYRGCLLVVGVDPQAMTERSLDEDHLVLQLRRLLGDIGEPDLPVLVRCVFTTEPFPEDLAAALAAYPRARWR